MQDYESAIEFIQHFVNFASYFIFSFIGSLLKEIYYTNTKKKYIFEPYKVVTGTIVASLCAVAVKAYFSEFLDQYWGMMGIVSLVLGFVGFELFRHISTLRGLKKIYSKVTDENSSVDRALEVIDDEPEPTDKKIMVNGPIARTLRPKKYEPSEPLVRNPNDVDGNGIDDSEENKK